ncbi:DUF5753 domain-containing protein [Actinomadura sp. GTD37]|uniref:DUF5753 domain-containing protein n=1 Tax=Actinomadura sp. GTD37 TaxID=1778030 RepID=UPI0035BF1068
MTTSSFDTFTGHLLPDVDARERWPLEAGTRLARQAILGGDEPVQYWAVLSEAVLHRIVGSSELMAEQLHALVAKVRQRNVKLQILPFSCGAHPAVSGAFTLVTLDLGEAAVAEYVYVENRAGSVMMDKAAEIEIHKLTFDALRADALGPEQSVALIQKAAAELV